MKGFLRPLVRRASSKRSRGAAGCAAFLLAASGLLAQAPAAPPIALRRLATGLASPTNISHAGDSRIFLVLKGGQVVIWNGASIRTTPFLDIAALVSTNSEEGLLGLAFHPQYATNGWFYIYYTNTSGSLVIARYHVLASDPNRADPASGVSLLTIPHPTFQNHNGGNLKFGPDGYLYIGTGDGGSGGDPSCNAQRSDVLLGKLLRIDVDQNTTAPPYYGIPPTNPFAGAGDPLDEIWARGLRNPWRFSFDRLTGDLFIADVGQGEREEIDFQPEDSTGGENYGWRVMEGENCYSTTSCPAYVPPCGSAALAAPIVTYGHGNGDCSVTGGYRYRGSTIPLLAGRYLYGDFCSGRIWSAAQAGPAWTPALHATTAANVSSFGEGPAGELYLTTLNGAFYRIVGPPHADFGGDGKTDLVWRNTSNGLDGVWNMDGTAVASVTSIPQVLDINWRIVGTADFNGDGKTDLLWHHRTSGATSIWLMNGTALLSMVAQQTVPDTTWEIEGTGDFNRDGRPDIVWRNRISGLNSVWLMQGTTFSSVASLPRVADANWRLSAIADFNSDGSSDLVWRHAVSGSTGIWLMNGTAYVSGVTLPTVADPGWQIDATGDFDGDDRADLVWRHHGTGLAGIWLMNGTAVSAVVSIPSVTDTNWELVGAR
ncbi:MAG: PQQ-dependent sugar dehydrogenase [Acidobacteriota bacterium]